MKVKDSGLGDIAYIRKNGVPIQWLAGVLGIPMSQARKRLADAPVMRFGKGRQPFYDTAQVFDYLVVPKRALWDWLRKLEPRELPPHLQPQAWQAVQRQHQVELASGQLWQTDEIVDMLVDLLSGLRSDLLMLSDNVERIAELTPEQRRIIRELSIEAVRNMYRRVREYDWSARPVRDKLSEHPVLTGEAEPPVDPPSDFAGGDDGIDDDVDDPFLIYDEETGEVISSG